MRAAIGGDSDIAWTEYALDLLPAGVGLRTGDHTFSVVGGVGLGGSTLHDAFAWDLPVIARAETSIGPIRLLGWGRFAWSPEDPFDAAYGAGLFSGRVRHRHGARFGRHELWLGLFTQRHLGMWATGLVLGSEWWGAD